LAHFGRDRFCCSVVDPGTVWSICTSWLGANSAERSELGADGVTGGAGIQWSVFDHVRKNGFPVGLLAAVESSLSLPKSGFPIPD
jgi:hypothetical protein